MIALFLNWNPSKFWPFLHLKTNWSYTWFNFIMYQMSCDVFHGAKNYFDISCKGRNYFSALQICGKECWFSNFFAPLSTNFFVSLSNGHIVCLNGIKRSRFEVTILKSNNYNSLVHKFKHQIRNLKKNTQISFLFEFFYYKPMCTLNFTSSKFTMSKNFTFFSSFLCVLWVFIIHVRCIIFHKIFAWSTWVFALELYGFKDLMHDLFC